MYEQKNSRGNELIESLRIKGSFSFDNKTGIAIDEWKKVNEHLIGVNDANIRLDDAKELFRKYYRELKELSKEITSLLGYELKENYYTSTSRTYYTIEDRRSGKNVIYDINTPKTVRSEIGKKPVWCGESVAIFFVGMVLNVEKIGCFSEHSFEKD